MVADVNGPCGTSGIPPHLAAINKTWIGAHLAAAARLVASHGRWMCDVATAIHWPRSDRIDAARFCRAQVIGDLNARFVPGDVAAVRIAHTHRLAAERILAADARVNDEAICVTPRVRNSTACATLAAATWRDNRNLRATDIPGGRAAERVERAHCSAAQTVAAVRCCVRDAARAGV